MNIIFKHTKTKQYLIAEHIGDGEIYLALTKDSERASIIDVNSLKDFSFEEILEMGGGSVEGNRNNIDVTVDDFTAHQVTFNIDDSPMQL